MRFSPVLTVALGAALLAACGGDSNNPSDNTAPAAAFTVACSDLACTFTDGSTDADGSIASRSWDFGDQTAAVTETNPDHTFGSANTYTVTLTVTDNEGATNAATKQVKVPNLPPTASFTSECSDLVCTFTDHSSDGDGTVASYDWDFGDGSSHVTTQAASRTFAAAGTYTVSLSVRDDGGASGSTTNDVTVTAPAAGGLKASFDVSCTSLDCTITNTTTGTGSVVTWDWDFGDGSPHSNVQNPPPVHYDITTLTTFTITLVVTSDGATSQATKQVTPTPAASLTCGDVACTLGLDQAATVVVTLTSRDCEAHGNTFVITAPVVDTLFTDGCFADVNSPFTLNGGAAFPAGTQLDAEVLTGVAGAQNPKLRVTGTFADGWTLEFDDGFVGPGEPDFNDLVITVKATPE
ncbi:MAG TPA: PKD domain-containing protein [Gemmatimonadales bacterium]|jgi:PKD repeat protein|nr:PKD domain-containing protein [Gemmatimonadales bacterium]